ncbi:MAG TPA: hypothetical protein VN645_10325 [Steroidobacteraceae bacterium]|nr:hypothetical protein [Steroidobacteraceae bacterium]
MSAELATRLDADTSAEPAQLFVINLCASTSPMALTHPNTPELKRYTFFVSRQREEGRERFRLHMGYFNSQGDAEALLSAVRDVYPAAWAGPAPTTGVPRRARVTAVPPAVIAAPVTTVTNAATPAATAPVKPVAPVAERAPVAQPAPAAAPALESMSNVRDVLAKLSDEAPTKDKAPPVKAAEATRRSDAVAPPAPKSEPASKAVPAKPVLEAAPSRAAPARSDVLELDASQTLRVLESPAPAASTTPAAARVQAVAPAQPAPVQPSLASPVQAASVPSAMAQSATVQLRDTSADVESEVRVVTPEDTQTLSDIRLDAQNNAPPCFAVQLIWAVAPIDVAALPHLAIFDAYSLYNVEGSRQGRKWYGLRLGFFSDPNSATQVAHYVRSDYPTVAVVPVAIKERDHAKVGTTSGAAPRLGEVAAPLKPESELSLEKSGLDGFELLQDDRPAPAKRDVDDIGAGAAKPAKSAQPAANAARPATAAAQVAQKSSAPVVAPKIAVTPAAAPRATGKPSGKRVVVRKRPQPSRPVAPGAPNPLESTLEILGASTLTLDDSREIVNDSAIRKPIEKKSGSRFSKLLNRLSGG